MSRITAFILGVVFGVCLCTAYIGVITGHIHL